MNTKIFLSTSVLLIAGCATTTEPDLISKINQEIECKPSAAGAVDAADDWARGYILVQPRAGLSNEKFDEVIRGNGGRSLGRIANLPVHKISVPEHAEDAVVRALSRNPSIKFAEKDMLMLPNEVIPDDPRFSEQWHLSKIQAPAAWSLAQGGEVVIAVLDTGVYGGHPDLVDKMVPGWNVVSGDTNTDDIHGHGTAVSGFVGAASNNAVGITSAGFNAKIMPIRITNSSDGAASYSSMANGITWAVDHGAKVVNISYKAFKSSTATAAANYMRSKGGVVVVGAGNDNTDLGYSNNASMITVAATTGSDTKASFSNYGDYIDVTAPGASVLTTNKGGGYNKWSGTSFSSPITAGVVGLIMSANPNLNPDQIERILESSADDLIAGVDWHMYYGHGRINAESAVQLALSTSAEDNQAPAVTIFSPSFNEIVKGNVLVEVSATDNMGVNGVSLYVGGEVIATDLSAPYQFSWDSTQVADGAISLSAKANDAALNEGVSNDVVLEVQNIEPEEDYDAPTVIISNPVDGSFVKRTVNISVSAMDNIQVAEIELFINGVVVSRVAADALNYSWNTRKVADGSYVISAIALDTSGNASDVFVIEVIIGGDTATTTKGNGRKK